MKLNWLDKIGNRNPQLLRELKRRLKLRNIMLASAISVLGQFVILFWSPDPFIYLSIIGIFLLLVAGTYLLISDLATEQHRGTLHLTRLSPQSTESILTGKLLGVPILLYLVAVLAVPLHLWTGLVVIPLGQILAFYGVLAASCIFFYSAALLYSLVSSWLGMFQVWLGSATVVAFLMLTQGISTTSYYNSTTWLKLLNPFSLLPNWSVSSYDESFATGLEGFRWFNLPLGDGVLTAVVFVLLNYGILTWFIWQTLHRCFRDSNATMLSKQQSYLLTVCFTLLTIGCANYRPLENRSPYAEPLSENLFALSLLNLLLFLYLIAAITPHRQTLQDWVRYRHKSASNSKRFGHSSLVKDLIWGEKSPAVVAIALNVVIVIIPLALFILLSPAQSAAATDAISKVNENRIQALFGLSVNASLMMIYASIAQLLLFMRTQQRTFWTAGTLGAVILLPAIIFAALRIHPFHPLAVVLLSIAFPFFPLLGTENVFLLILVQGLILVLLNLQLTRHLRQAGEQITESSHVTSQ